MATALRSKNHGKTAHKARTRSAVRGFTIVELLIVIVVIGILAALVITTFSGIQARGRNTERQTDIKAVHGQLEAYAAQYGSYPQKSDLDTALWRTNNMRGLDAGAVQDPKWTSANASCTAGGISTFSTAAAANCYAYIVLPAACTTALNNCASYTLTATAEGLISGLPTYSKTSLN